MGCDIHGPYIEALDNPDWWESKGTIEVGRNYTLFSILAGVRSRDRNILPPIAEARGFPPQADYDATDAHDDSSDDAHHASWLTVGEIDRYLDVNGDKVTLPTGAPLTVREAMQDIVRALPWLRALGDPEKVRLVFWFDN